LRLDPTLEPARHWLARLGHGALAVSSSPSSSSSSASPNALPSASPFAAGQPSGGPPARLADAGRQPGASRAGAVESAPLPPVIGQPTRLPPIAGPEPILWEPQPPSPSRPRGAEEPPSRGAASALRPPAHHPTPLAR
jgi:hypothetical protein